MTDNWPWDWSATDWATIATLALALVTAVMAYETRKMAAQTRDDAAATTRAAIATEAAAVAAQESAAATVRLVVQGRFAFSPVLAAEVVSTTSDEDGTGSKVVTLVNVGPGPALGCTYAFQSSSRWACTLLVHLGPNSEQPGLNAFPRVDEPVPFTWFQFSGSKEGAAESVIFCRDIYDRRYRYLIAHGGHVLPAEIFDPPTQPTVGGLDRWSTDPRLWGG